MSITITIRIMAKYSDSTDDCQNDPQINTNQRQM